MGDSKQFRAYYVGKSVEVLIEEKKKIDGKEYWIGHTKEYVKVATRVKGEKNLQNQLLTGNITDFLNDEILIMEV